MPKWKWEVIPYNRDKNNVIGLTADNEETVVRVNVSFPRCFSFLCELTGGRPAFRTCSLLRFCRRHISHAHLFLISDSSSLDSVSPFSSLHVLFLLIREWEELLLNLSSLSSETNFLTENIITFGLQRRFWTKYNSTILVFEALK